MTCGVCGAGYTLVGNDRYACADHVNRGTCANGRTIPRKVIERRVLSGIREKLLSPDLIKLFVQEFTAGWNARVASQRQSMAALEAEIADIDRRLQQIVAAIEQGVVTATTKDRLLELEARRESLKAQLAAKAAPAVPPALHPGLAELYRRKVAELETALDGEPIRGEAALALRELVDRVVLHPGEKRGEMRAELHGVLAALLHADAQNAKTRLHGRRPPASRPAIRSGSAPDSSSELPRPENENRSPRGAGVSAFTIMAWLTGHLPPSQ